MPAEKDPIWKYAEVVVPGKKWRCNFCKKVYAGKAPRIKAHLANIRGRDIAVCGSVDETAKNEAKRALQKDTSDEEGHPDRGPESSSKRQRSSDQSGFAIEIPETNSQGQHGIMLAPSCNAPIMSQPDTNYSVRDQLGAAGQAEAPNGEFERTDLSLPLDVLGQPDRGREAFLTTYPFGKEFEDQADVIWNYIIEMHAACGDCLDMEKKDFIERKLFYDYLTPEKKQCFLRCALYPYGGIERSDLIELFIDDGLIFGPYDRWTMYENGHRILDELIDVHLLEKPSEDTVRMHRMIRVMAIYVMRASHSAIIQAGLQLDDAPNTACWPRDVQMVSLMKNKISGYSLNRAMPDYPKLSVLLLNGNELLHDVPESFFKHLPGLKVLNMSHTMIKALPDSISGLVKLEALLLKECKRLSHIPSLAKMRSLRKLDLCGCEALEREPLGLESLVNITYLDLFGTGIQTLPELENIQYLGYNEEEDFYDFRDLKTVQFLRCSKSIFDLISFLKLDNPQTLMCYIFVDENEESDFPSSNHDWAVRWSHKSSPCDLGIGNIKKRFIRICVAPGDEFSLEEGEYLPEGPFVCVVYRGTQSGDLILRGLVLHRCPALNYAFTATTRSVSLEYLEELYLSGCDNMEGIIAPTLQIPPNTLHRLTRIYVDSCPKIGILLPAALLPHLGKLRKISVYICSEMEDIIQLDQTGLSGVVLDSLDEIDVRSCDNLTRLLPAALLPHLGKLRKICIKYCGEMGDIIQLDQDVLSGVDLGSLDEIDVEDCDNLARLLPAALLPHLGKLRKIYVYYCEKMRDIIQWDQSVLSGVDLGSLDEIDVSICPNLTRLLPAALLPHLGKLRKISVCWCDEMGDIIQLDQAGLSGVDLGSLDEIDVRHCHNLARLLPAALLPHLGKLRKISAYSCVGMGDIIQLDQDIIETSRPVPRGVQLTSLVEIKVSGCDNLTRLFPAELLPHLQQLERITVLGCKGMKEVIENGNGSKTRGEASNLPLFPSPLSLPHLTSLQLESLPELEKICGGTLTSSYCTFSTGHIVSISKCPKLEGSNGRYNYLFK